MQRFVSLPLPLPLSLPALTPAKINFYSGLFWLDWFSAVGDARSREVCGIDKTTTSSGTTKLLHKQAAEASCNHFG